jgi:hypothetical protein
VIATEDNTVKIWTYQADQGTGLVNIRKSVKATEGNMMKSWRYQADKGTGLANPALDKTIDGRILTDQQLLTITATMNEPGATKENGKEKGQAITLRNLTNPKDIG